MHAESFRNTRTYYADAVYARQSRIVMAILNSGLQSVRFSVYRLSKDGTSKDFISHRSQMSMT